MYCPDALVPIDAGDVPHDWLFGEGRVSAVCIHGGAGTMAIALKNGLPTIVGTYGKRRGHGLNRLNASSSLSGSTVLW